MSCEPYSIIGGNPGKLIKRFSNEKLSYTKEFYMDGKAKANKPKIMLHIIMPNQVSGPNSAARLIGNSHLKEKYEFAFLTQTKHSGQRINFSLINDLRKQIIAFDPDVIHLTGLLGAGFHAVLAAWASGKRNILLTVRGTATDAINISSTSRFIFGNIVEPLTMRLSRKVFTVAEAMAKREYIEKHTRGKLLEPIHNCAPTDNYSNIPVFDLRIKLGIGDDAKLVVIVGRMVFDKGVTYIADAIKQIDRQDIKFIFVGDKPHSNFDLEDILQNEISQNRVFFLGQQKDVLSILKECDIFLFGTLHENLSNALLEACSVGLAVIATNVGGNPEVIEHDYNGLLISPANSDEIRKSVLDLVDNEKLRLRYGAKAKETVESKFSQKNILSKLERVYDEMLK